MARLRSHTDEIERSERVINQFKKESGLTLTQLEKSWSKMRNPNRMRKKPRKKRKYPLTGCIEVMTQLRKRKNESNKL